MNNLAVLFAAVALVAAGCGGGDDNAEPAGGEETVASGQVPFDRAFIDAMVPHHREAIEMARAALDRGLTQPELRTIAKDIVASQQQEIDRMLALRETWFGSGEPGPISPEVLGLSEEELGMAGMGHSADDIETSDDVDATFAQLMLPHHEGAVRLAQIARTRADHVEIRQLAQAIIEAQQREIGTLQEHASAEHHTP